MKDFTEIIEIGPREGLQHQDVVLTTDQKLLLIRKLLDAGFKSIEITSLVNPKLMPQMSDGFELITKINEINGTRAQVLVANETGARNAIAFGVKCIVVWVYITDELNRISQNRGISETLKEIYSIVRIANNYNVKVGAWIAGAFGYKNLKLNYPLYIQGLISRLLETGCVEVCLADEFCMADPFMIRDLLTEYLDGIDKSKLLMHFHNDKGMGLANIIASHENGIRKFKTCIGGIGEHKEMNRIIGGEACPSIATEDVVYAFNKMQVKTGINIDKLLECSKLIKKFLNIEDAK